MAAVDPWYDYLALPVAPMILLVQGAALFFLPRGPLRWALVAGGAIAIAAMLVLVATIPSGDEGANIGAGVMFLWLMVAGVLVVAAAVTGRRRTTAPAAIWSKTAIGALIVTLFFPPFALVALAATGVAWRREGSSTTRKVATWSSALAVPYAVLYAVVENV